MNDFLVEDIIKPMSNKKKKDGGRKGKRVERELAKIFTNRFGKDFSRSVGSGNRWGQVQSMPSHAKETYSGDITCCTGFKWVLESKGGYEEIDIHSIFIKGHSKLNDFLKQVKDESERCNRKPMLLWKKDRKPWLAFVLSGDLKGEFSYKLSYKEWVAVALEELLKLDDEFFIESNGG